ncbi:MAG: flagellar assembly protein FliW, partial [Sulfurimonas sp.]
MLKSDTIDKIKKRFFMKFDMVTPLLGFEEIKQVELQKIDDIFMRMQSSQNENISFTLVNPYALREYDFEVPKNLKEELEITVDSNILIYNILLIQTPIEDSIVNFIGPLVFNSDVNKAAQI